jgi:hypothetical protein
MFEISPYVRMATIGYFPWLIYSVLWQQCHEGLIQSPGKQQFNFVDTVVINFVLLWALCTRER